MGEGSHPLRDELVKVAEALVTRLAGLPECVSCHDNHEVRSLDPAAIERQCEECHGEGSEQVRLGRQLVTVLRGTGEAVVGAQIQLIRTRMTDLETKLDLVAEAATDTTGTFYFDFVEDPAWDPAVRSGFTLRATVPEGDQPGQPAQVQEIGSIIRDANRNKLGYVNIALLGRGTVTGRLLYAATAVLFGWIAEHASLRCGLWSQGATLLLLLLALAATTAGVAGTVALTGSSCVHHVSGAGLARQ